MRPRLLPLVTLLLLLVPGLASAGNKLKKASDADLLQALSDPDKGVRIDAAKLVGDRKVAGGVAALLPLIAGDDDVGVRLSGVRALLEYAGQEATDALETVFLDTRQDGKVLARALAGLMKRDPTRAQDGVPYYLARYRKNDPELNLALLDALGTIDRPDARDLPLVVVMDVGQPKKVRVAALDVLEKDKHPGVHEAYFALVSDDEKAIKLRCVQGLSRSGLPPQRVIDALSAVVRQDRQGDVRAAALKGLKLYANPGLLPLLHTVVATDKHVVAWSHAMDMLFLLADASSYDTFVRMLAPDFYLSDEWTVRAIHVLVTIGNPAAVPTLAALRDRAESETVKVECQRAIDLLAPAAVQERIVVIERYVRPADVVIIDLSAPVVEASYELNLSLDASGVVVGAGGTAFSLGASVRVTE